MRSSRTSEEPSVIGLARTTRGLTRGPRGELVSGGVSTCFVSGGVAGGVASRDIAGEGGVARIAVRDGAEGRLVPVRRQPVAIELLALGVTVLAAARRRPTANIGVACGTLRLHAALCTAGRGGGGSGAGGAGGASGAGGAVVGDGAAAPVALAAQRAQAGCRSRRDAHLGGRGARRGSGLGVGVLRRRRRLGALVLTLGPAGD